LIADLYDVRKLLFSGYEELNKDYFPMLPIPARGASYKHLNHELCILYCTRLLENNLLSNTEGAFQWVFVLNKAESVVDTPFCQADPFFKNLYDDFADMPKKAAFDGWCEITPVYNAESGVISVRDTLKRLKPRLAKEEPCL
jgi:hypothetical protein